MLHYPDATVPLMVRSTNFTLKITASPRRNRRSKTRRSESPELNPSSRKGGKEEEEEEEEREDDGTGSSRRRKRRRKIPEINFEMEKGEKGQQQQQQQLSKELGTQQQQQQQFSITETLPEHFRKALMKSLFPTSKADEEEDKELEHTSDATKRRKIATIFGSRCPSLANEEEEEGPLTIGTATARARSSRVNPLKLIRRFVPGTNQEEYKVEGRGKKMVKGTVIKEEIVVDLASDDDDCSGGGDNKNQISREKSISEAYLRAARMPLINVSLVSTKGEDQTENERERAIVRLERLSKREIDRHLKRSKRNKRRGDDDEEEEEEDVVEVVVEQVFGREEENLKDFKDLIGSQDDDPGTARERRGHLQQLRRRNSFACYRNDAAAAVALGRQPSPLNLEPLKQGCCSIELFNLDIWLSYACMI